MAKFSQQGGYSVEEENDVFDNCQQAVDKLKTKLSETRDKLNDCVEKMESIDIDSLLWTYHEIIESYEEYIDKSEACVARFGS